MAGSAKEVVDDAAFAFPCELPDFFVDPPQAAASTAIMETTRTSLWVGRALFMTVLPALGSIGPRATRSWARRRSGGGKSLPVQARRSHVLDLRSKSLP